jgi:MerR family transcriptional regulator, copper efflux regulator
MRSQQENSLLIGQVTNLSGVPIRTIRYYEGLGLIHAQGRTEGGFRQFSDEVLTRLSFIKRAQSLGLSLEEIGNILAVYDKGEIPCREIKEHLEHKIIEINQQVDKLLALREKLKTLVSDWQSPSVQDEHTICPIIQNNS